MEVQTAINTIFEAQAKWKAEKLGKFSSSELHRLMKGGKRDMTEEELKAAKAEKSKRTTVDTLFGDGAITYINEKIAEIITGDQKDDISTLKALEWGAANENEAVYMFADKIGKPVQYYGVANPKFISFNHISGGSPDGVIVDESVLEAKCPYVSANHIEYLLIATAYPDDAAMHTEWLRINHYDYFIQTQFNMMCCKLDKAHFISYDPRMLEQSHKLAHLTILPVPEIQTDIEHRINEGAKLIQSHLMLLFKND